MNNTMSKKDLEKEINQGLQNAKIDLDSQQLLDGIDSLPNYIEDKGEYTYMPFVIRTDHEISFPDSYIAIYGRRIENGLSTKNYLFLVASDSPKKTLGKFLLAYRELVKRKLIKDNQWVCPYKGLKLMIHEKDIEHSKMVRDL